MAGQSKEIVTRASATQNLGAFPGYIVKESGAAGAVALATAGADSDNFGVIWSAEDLAAGQVAVCVDGRCKVVAGGAFTPGGQMWFTTDANGKARSVGNTSNLLIVGRILSNVVVASGDIVDCIVSPHFGQGI
jgi:hypothetical protein